jgi:DNA-binding CsgD family transcriptional regulator
MFAMGDSQFTDGAPVDQPHILFVGSQFVFPDLILRLVRNEFRGLGVARREALEIDRMPAPSGLRLVVFEDTFARELEQRFEALRAALPGVPIALAYRDKRVALRLLGLQQAEGRLDGLRFLPINAPIAALVPMLQLLLAGDFVVPGELVLGADAEHRPPPTPAPAVLELLTQRELEVLDLVAQGRRNKTIASELGVSEHTVKLHIHHIISKIQVGNRTEATMWYLAQGKAERGRREGS